MDAFKKDFLTEVLNIGLGRAGTVLGQISGAHVGMTVPDLTVCKAADLPRHLSVFGGGEVLTVTMPFTGILSGDAMFVVSPFSGRLLSQSLFKELLKGDVAEADLGPAVTELGNIVINYFVGSWSEIFYDRFRFGVPCYQRDPIEEVVAAKIRPNSKKGPELYAVCAEAHLDIPEFFAMASLVTLFDQTALEKLVGSLEPAAEG